MIGHISGFSALLPSWLHYSKIQAFGAMKNFWKGKVIGKREETSWEEKKSQQ